MARTSNLLLLSLWKQRIDDQRSSGVSVQEFCRQHSLQPYAFYFWRRKIASLPHAATPKGLIPVRVVNAKPPIQTSQGLASIQFLSGVTIQADAQLVRVAIDQILASEQSMRGTRP